LCEESLFSELEAKLSEFPISLDLKEAETETQAEAGTGTEDANADAPGRIAGLEDKANQHSHVIGLLQHKVTQLFTGFGHLRGEVSGLRSVAAGSQIFSEEVFSLKMQHAK
jgi:hypothetical protein